MVNTKDRRRINAELRRGAEEQLQGQALQEELPLSQDEALRLVHELRVHRIELEMQNAELLRVREELEESLEQYSDLYDFAPVGYLTLDRNGIIRKSNLAGAGLLGIARSRLIGRLFGLFIAAKERSAYNDFLDKVFTSPDKEVCELVLAKEGHADLTVQIEGVAAASRMECRIALIDISERRKAEESRWLAKEAVEAICLAKESARALQLEKEAGEALRLAKEAAEATTRLRSQFLANMSHELRTPLTSVIGYSQVLLDEKFGPLNPNQQEYVNNIISSGKHQLNLINDVLDMTKIESGKFDIEEIPFSPRRCLGDVVDAIMPEARRKGLVLAVTVGKDLPDSALGDQLRLRQVLINLIANAVKFTEDGQVEVDVRVGETTCDRRRQYTFTVTDTGIGIPDDKQELIFQAFTQVDVSHSRKFGGTGLGLAISKEIVGLMGGSINFESKVGVGSSFSFSIPLGDAGMEIEAQASAETHSPVTTTFAPEGDRMPRLLLVEDDQASRQVLELLLRHSNFQLDLAEDGFKAIEMWEKGEYDLVLMDVQMPRLNGFEATRSIREKERERGGHTLIVAMTAHAGKEDERRCLDAGMDAFISKPIDFKKCMQFIGQLIMQKSSGDNLSSSTQNRQLATENTEILSAQKH